MANFQRNLSKYIVVVLTRRTEHEPSQVCSRGCSGAGCGCSRLRQRLGHAEWAVVGRAGVQRGAGALGLRAVSLLVAAQLLWLGTAVGLALRLAPLVTSAFAGGPKGPPAFCVIALPPRGARAALARHVVRPASQSAATAAARQTRPRSAPAAPPCRASCAATGCGRWSGSTPPSPWAAFPARARRRRRG